MQAFMNAANAASRVPGGFYALGAAAQGANLVYQVAARGTFIGGGYAYNKSVELKNWAASKVFTPVVQTEEEAEAATEAAEAAKTVKDARYDTYVKPVVEFGPVATLLKQFKITETSLWDLGKNFATTAIFSVALLEGAAFVFGESPLNVNAVLKFVSPVRFSNESVLGNLGAALATAYGKGSAFVAPYFA